jgi:pimeloyl-ACP methyl ester carboxylesterase
MTDATAAAATAPSAAPSPAPPEGCPTPLAWQEVLAGYRAERRERCFSTGWGEATVWEFGEGPPLWFVGPAAGDGELFALTAYLLREQRRCAVLSLPDPPRDFPRSDWLRGWSAIATEVVSQCGDARTPVVGAGWGGLVALQMTLDAPSQVERLVLQGTATSLRLNASERWLLAAGERLPGTLGHVPGWRRIVEANHRPWFPPFDAGRFEFLRDNLATTPIRRFAQRTLLLARNDLGKRLREVACPVLVVRTEGEGAAWTAAQESLAAALPDARVEWLHSAGHFPWLTHPHRVVKEVREFVGGSR